MTVTVAKSVASGGSADKGPAGPFYAGDSDRARTLRTARHVASVGVSWPSRRPDRLTRWSTLASPVSPTVPLPGRRSLPLAVHRACTCKCGSRRTLLGGRNLRPCEMITRDKGERRRSRVLTLRALCAPTRRHDSVYCCATVDASVSLRVVDCRSDSGSCSRPV